MSLGILGSTQGTKKVARPLGFRPARGYSLRGALGASNIPGTCWDVPGFKDCHAAQWKYAQKKCEGGEAAKFGGSVDKCIEAYTDDLAWVSCVPEYCPQTSAPARKSGSDGIPVYGDGIIYKKVTALQTLLNKDLLALKYNLIGVDGKLGKGTCGATLLASYKPNAFPTTMAQWDSYVDVSSACTGQPYVLPKPKTGAPNIAKDFVEWVADQAVEGGGEAPPWMGEPNAGIAQWQGGELSTVLQGLGYEPIPATGQIDPLTCGAMKVSDAKAGTSWLVFNGKNCQSFQTPSLKASPSPVVAKLGPVPQPLPTTTTPGRTSQVSMATTGLILGALGVGVYFAGKKLNWF